MAARPKAKKPTTAAMLKALAHADRIEILKHFEPTDGAKAAEISSKMLAGRMGKPLSNMSYHVKALREAGLLYTARYEPRRGAREAYQRLTPLGESALDLIEHAENVST